MKCRLFSFTIICLLLVSGTPAKAGEVYAGLLEEGQYGYVPTRIMQEAYGRIGVVPESVGVESVCPLAIGNSHECDSDMCRIAGWEKNNPQLIRIPVPIFFADIVVLSKEPAQQIDGWESLSSLRVGIPMRTGLVDQSIVSCFQSRSYDSVPDAIMLLQQGEIDVALCEQRLAARVLMELGVTDVHILMPPLQSIELYHYVHQRDAWLVPRLTQVLEEMATSGKILRMNQGLPE